MGKGTGILKYNASETHKNKKQNWGNYLFLFILSC